MGKAFSEEEKKIIQERLTEVGLKLLAQKGIKDVSISDITKAAGIAQGSFYSFYKSKEDFVMALFKERAIVKIKNEEEHFQDTLKNPVGYLADMMFDQGMHLKDNKAFNEQKSGSWYFLLGREPEEKIEILRFYRDFLRKLFCYWEEHGYEVQYDMDGLINAISMATVIFSNADKVNKQYFSEIYRVYCNEVVAKFLQVSKCR